MPCVAGYSGAKVNYSSERARALTCRCTAPSARVDARSIDDDVEGPSREIASNCLQRSGPAAELAAHLRDHEVTDGELNPGMAAVDLPTFGAHGLSILPPYLALTFIGGNGSANDFGTAFSTTSGDRSHAPDYRYDSIDSHFERMRCHACP